MVTLLILKKIASALLSWKFWRYAAILLVSVLLVYSFMQTPPVRSLADELLKNNPQGKADFERMKRDFDAAAAEATAHYYHLRHQNTAGSILAADLASGKAHCYVELCGVMAKAGDEFAAAHYDELAVFDYCAQHLTGNAGKAAAQLLEQRAKTLRAAKEEGGRTWDVVRDNPFSATVYGICKETGEAASTWEAYCRYDWMPWAASRLVLMDITTAEEGADNMLPLSEVVLEFIRLCEQYPSMREFVADVYEIAEQKTEDETALEELHLKVLFNLALAYDAYHSAGTVIETICASKINPAVVIDVLAQNTPMLQAALQEEKQDTFCEWVVGICQSTNLCELAQQVPGMLMLYSLAPTEVEQIKAQCWVGGGVPMLYTACMDENGTLNKEALRQGLKAMAKYHELALWVFTEDNLGGNVGFHKLLAQDWRVVAYLAKHAEEGIAALECDIKLIDDELTKSGEPLKVSAWKEYLPGHDIWKVATRLMDGRPPSLSDLGWAALDIASFVPVAGVAGKGIKGGKLLNIGFKIAGGVTKTLTKTAARALVKKSPKIAAKVAVRTGRESGLMAHICARGGAKAAAGFFKCTYKVSGKIVKSGSKTLKWFARHPKTAILVSDSIMASKFCVKNPEEVQRIMDTISTIMEDPAGAGLEQVKGAFKKLASAMVNRICSHWPFSWQQWVGILLLFSLTVGRYLLRCLFSHVRVLRMAH